MTYDGSKGQRLVKENDKGKWMPSDELGLLNAGDELFDADTKHHMGVVAWVTTYQSLKCEPVQNWGAIISGGLTPRSY